LDVLVDKQLKYYEKNISISFYSLKIIPFDYDNVEEELHDHIIMFEMFDHLDLLMTERKKYFFIFIFNFSNTLTCSAEVVLTISCNARTDTACSSTNTHDAKSGQQT
jgi:hypothetical protein